MPRLGQMHWNTARTTAAPSVMHHSMSEGHACWSSPATMMRCWQSLLTSTRHLGAPNETHYQIDCITVQNRFRPLLYFYCFLPLIPVGVAGGHSCLSAARRVAWRRDIPWVMRVSASESLHHFLGLPLALQPEYLVLYALGQVGL